MKKLTFDSPIIVHSITVLLVLMAVAAVVLVAISDNVVVSLVIR